MALLLEWERGWQREEQREACCPVAALKIDWVLMCRFFT